MWVVAFALTTSLLLVLGLVWVRVVRACRSEFQAAGEARARGDLAAAVEAYDRALHWYAPANPHHRRAAAALWEIAEGHERVGERRAALEAYGRLRGAILSTRGFVQPLGDWVARAEDRIADLMVEEEMAEMAQASPPATERERMRAWHLERLRRRFDPHPGWSAAAVAGFLGWVGATLGFIFRAFDREGRLLPARALRWGAPVGVFFALWVAALLAA